MSTPSLFATNLQHTLPNCNTLQHTERDSCVFLLQEFSRGCRPHIFLQRTCYTLCHVAIHYTTLKYVCLVFAGMLQRMSTPYLFTTHLQHSVPNAIHYITLKYVFFFLQECCSGCRPRLFLHTKQCTCLLSCVALCCSVL